ncbi:rca [Scenedesmus sp. PABB004]|nr:rca [Scenedesmus sp. PABB004]
MGADAGGRDAVAPRDVVVGSPRAGGPAPAAPPSKNGAPPGAFAITLPPAEGKHDALLEGIPPERQLGLRFERICAHVNTDYDTPGVLTRLRRATDRAARAAAEERKQKQILFDVSGEMRPGEMLALMGPSGSGKTSLLSIISGRAPRAVTTSGRVTSNGEKFSKAAKRRVGFVLQDDLLYESLTVWETLGYAAALRLPRSMGAAARAERVEAVLAALGLTKCRDTIIGGFFRRGISGGERKRVSIGHELLINPAILLLDEPTSGLDATTALHLLVTLRQLALGGRAIATTIHQPSSRLFMQLDRLMLLAEGHVMYYGAASGVVPWFSGLGFEMPYGVNVADFLLDLAQGEVEGSEPPAGAEQQQQQQQQQQQGKAGAGGGGAGGGVLSGPRAVRALYSSYETFACTHRGGFEGTPEQAADVTLALEPPLSKRQRAAAAAAAAAGLDPAAAASAAGRRSLSRGNGSLLGRSLSKAGSFLGLDSMSGGARRGDDSDDELDCGAAASSLAGGESAAKLGRGLTRIWSRSSSAAALAGPAGFAGRLAAGLGVADRGGASYLTQWQVLLQRCIKVKRFESLSGQRFMQGAIVAVITGMFWWQRGRGNTLLAASDVVGLLFFELLFPAFTALFSALFTFPNDYRMLLKERASGMYRVSAFYLASALSDLPMDCALPAMFVVIIYFMGGLRLTAAAFLGNLLGLVLNVLVAQSMGLLLGVAFMNPKTAQTVASIIMLGFMLVGGYYVRGIPAWIGWVRYTSFVYWGFNLLVKIEFSGATYYACGAGGGLAGAGGVAHTSESAAPCAPLPNLQAALQLPTDPGASPALEIGVLFAMLVLLRTAVYYVLRHKTKAACGGARAMPGLGAQGRRPAGAAEPAAGGPRGLTSAAGPSLTSRRAPRRPAPGAGQRQQCIAGSSYYPPGSPRPLSELMATPQPPPGAASPPPASPPARPAAAGAPGAAPAAPAAAHSAAARGGGPPPRGGAASAAGGAPGGAVSAARRPGSSPGPGTGLGGRLAAPHVPAPGGGAGPGASSVGAAGVPHPFTEAPPYEAFEPGDSGFSAPTSAEVVTSSSGSVMVKLSAHFSGQVGDKVLVCGGCKALGNWEPDAAPSLTWGEGDVWTATLELPPGTFEFKSVAVKPTVPLETLVWEPGNNRRVVVPRVGGLPPGGDELDLGLGLLGGEEEEQPAAQLVETSGGSTMVKLTTTYTAAFGEYLKVVGGPAELGAWDAGAAPALTWGEGDVWTATLELPAGEHEFKYVVVRQDGRLEWEPGENRRIHVPLPGLAAALAAAKAAVAAEEADGADGRARAAPPGRKLSPAEVYKRQEATEQLEPWQHVEREAAVAAAAAAGDGDPPAAAAGEPAPPAVPAGWREVKFSTRFKAAFGTFLKAVGGPEPLGAWDVDAAPPLQWSEGDVWSATLLLPPGQHEFKLMVVNADGTFDWEAGDNRTVSVEASAAAGEAPGSVLVTECEYGATGVTSSVWASVDEVEAAPAPAEEAAAPEQAAAPAAPPAEAAPVAPEEWYAAQRARQAEAAEAAAAAAAAAAPPPPAPPAPAAPPASPAPPRPLQPLDAVVKVFKDRFAPRPRPPAPAPAAAADAGAGEASPAGSPTGSADEDGGEAGLGGRFASVIASRRGGEPGGPAVLFVDPPAPGPTPPWEQVPEGGASAAPEQQQPGGARGDGGDAPERFASQIAAARSRQTSPVRGARDAGAQRGSWRASPTPPEPAPEAPPAAPPAGQEGDRWAGFNWRRSEPEQQQEAPRKSGSWNLFGWGSKAEPEAPPQREQQPPAEDRWAGFNWRREQPAAEPEPPRQAEQQPAAEDRWAGFNWRREQPAAEPEPPRQAEQQPATEDRWAGFNWRREQPAAEPEPPRQAEQQPAAEDRWAGFNWRREQPAAEPEPPRQAEQQPAAEDRWAGFNWRREQPAAEPEPPRQAEQQPAAEDRWAGFNWRREQPAAEPEPPRQAEQQPAAEDRWAGFNWRREQPAAEPEPPRQAEQQPAAEDRWAGFNWRREQPAAEPEPPRQAEQQPAAEDRWAGFNWRRDSADEPEAEAGAPQQRQDAEPTTDRWAGFTWRRSDDGSAAADGGRPVSPSWRAPSPVGEPSSSSSSSEPSSGRFSKFTDGSSWRSASPAPPPREATAPPEPEPEPEPEPPRWERTWKRAAPEPEPEPAPAPEPAPRRDEPGAAAAGGRFAGYVARGGGARGGSSWDAKEAGGGGGDYLYQLGRSDYNTNVDAGQNSDMIDYLFTGNVLGHKTDIADGSLRGWEARTLNNIVGDYYIAPVFMERVAMHITKNYLADQGAIDASSNVPLILGIWGPKGCGKTFQTELAFKKLGVQPVVMSAGELESESAGQPGRLIRERYRKAAELGKVRGKLSCLLINDLDAGIGRFGNTQCTVNNQIVIGTLMNICDDPNRVSLGAGWRENDTIRRVPIIVTGNDFSTLYAPLIRDGRMDKFYWTPSRDDIVAIVHQMYKEDGLSRGDVCALVDTFSNQALDFFGALRAATYDGQIREWMADVAGAPLHAAGSGSISEVNRRLLSQQGVPEFEPAAISLDGLVAEGRRLVAEQELVNSSKLSEAYMRGVAWGERDAAGGGGGIRKAGGPQSGGARQQGAPWVPALVKKSGRGGAAARAVPAWRRQRRRSGGQRPARPRRRRRVAMARPASVGRKAASETEDELLQRRIAHAQWLAGLLSEPGSTASLTVGAYGALLDELLLDVAVEAHREARTGVLPPAPPPPRAPRPPPAGATDAFGQVHPGSATDVVVCMNCGRKAAAGRFAYHLEKCLGKGRTQGAGARTSRRTGA